MSKSDPSCVVRLDQTLLPKSKRLHIGRYYLRLSNPDIKVPLEWDFDKHRPFLQFLGYWFGKGYFEKYAVVVPGGKYLPDLIPVFDYISDIFKCNYKIKPNKLVQFDSAVLKYTMMGLSFTCGKKSEKSLPNWTTQMEISCLQDFLRGYFTAVCKITDRAIFCNCNNSIVQNQIFVLLNRVFVSSHYYQYSASHQNKLIIGEQGLKMFREQIGFIAASKNLDLDGVLLIKHL